MQTTWSQPVAEVVFSNDLARRRERPRRPWATSTRSRDSEHEHQDRQESDVEPTDDEQEDGERDGEQGPFQIAREYGMNDAVSVVALLSHRRPVHDSGVTRCGGHWRLWPVVVVVAQV